MINSSTVPTSQASQIGNIQNQANTQIDSAKNNCGEFTKNLNGQLAKTTVYTATVVTAAISHHYIQNGACNIL